MTLNGVMALILRYFTEFGSFRGPLRKSGLLAINRFSPEKCHKVHRSTKRHGRAVLFAVAELLICLSGTLPVTPSTSKISTNSTTTILVVF